MQLGQGPWGRELGAWRPPLSPPVRNHPPFPCPPVPGPFTTWPGLGKRPNVNQGMNRLTLAKAVISSDGGKGHRVEESKLSQLSQED